MSVKEINPNPKKNKEITVAASQSNLKKQSEYENFDAIIIGGGISGLTAAHRLKERKVLILEKSAHFGGNARSETNNGLPYPTAGSCFKTPDPDGSMAWLLKSLKIWGQWKNTGEDTIVFFQTTLLLRCLPEVTLAFLKQPHFLLKWESWKLTFNLILALITRKQYVLSPKSLGEPVFADLFEYLDQFSIKSGQFPAIPFTAKTDSSRELLNILDSVSLEDLLFHSENLLNIPDNFKPKKKFGQLVRQAIETTLRVECMEIKDVSAYVGIHFLIGYLQGELVAFPGGNGYISESILKVLRSNDKIRMETGSQVVSISCEDSFKLISIKQGASQFKVKTKNLIWAAPKADLPHTMPWLPSEKIRNIAKINHHDYVIASVIMKKPVLTQYFGGYIIGKTSILPKDSWCSTGACVVANWLDSSDNHNSGVLSLLKPIASTKYQGRLFKEDIHQQVRNTHQEIKILLQNCGIDPELIKDIHIWKWPTSLVVPKIGQIKDAVFKESSRPWQGIYFANQDSIGIGNIESSIIAGRDAADQVHDALNASSSQSQHISLVDS